MHDGGVGVCGMLECGRWREQCLPKAPSQSIGYRLAAENGARTRRNLKHQTPVALHRFGGFVSVGAPVAHRVNRSKTGEG
jgi:hypothetical protein